MPFVAHNNEWLLGFGDTAEIAERRMRRDYPDLSPVVEPASSGLIRSLEVCPLTDASTAKLNFEVNHVGPRFSGVLVLPEEFQVLRQGIDRYGLSHKRLLAEIAHLTAI